MDNNLNALLKRLHKYGKLDLRAADGRTLHISVDPKPKSCRIDSVNDVTGLRSTAAIAEPSGKTTNQNTQNT